MRSILQLVPAGLAVLLLPTGTAAAQLLDAPEPSDYFGWAIGTGDFDGDGYTDLVVGVPSESQGSFSGAGQIHVIYGTASGLSAVDNQVWHKDSPGIDGQNGQAEAFGYSLSVGDFNGDGFDDVAVGIPFENTPTGAGAGAVSVLYGSAVGLGAVSNQHWTQLDWGSFDEAGDNLGRSLAAGDFDGDGFDDLALGVPFEDDNTVEEVGIVHILYGTAAGLDAARHQQWWRDNTGTGTNDEGGRFGEALSVGDFDGDGFDDLVIGVPYDNHSGFLEPGSVVVLYGTGAGLSSTGSQLWRQGAAGLPGTAGSRERFGFSLATGDFDGDGFDDLVVGAPLNDLGSFEDVGNMTHIYGTASGLSATRSGAFTGSTVGLPLEAGGRFGSSLAAGDFDGDGYDDVAIGAPNISVPGADAAGAIAVVRGLAGGLTVTEAATFTQHDPGVDGEIGIDDQFGYALASGDFNGAGSAAVVAGAPYDDDTGVEDAGTVTVLYAVFNGLDNSQLWFQGANPVAVEPDSPGRSAPLALLPAYPNPFNPSTLLRYDVTVVGHVRLSVFDALGRRVAVLADNVHAAGRHAAEFDASNLPSGLYLVRMEAAGAVQTQQITLLR